CCAGIIQAAVAIQAAANDWFFWLGAVEKNLRAVAGMRRIITLPNNNHGLGFSPTAQDLNMFIDNALHDGPGYPEIVGEAVEPVLPAGFRWKAAGPRPIKASWLYFSPGADLPWASRYWYEVPAREAGGVWQAELPGGLANVSGVAYATILDHGGALASSMTAAVPGEDPAAVSGRAWPGGSLWDKESGAKAWRSCKWTRCILYDEQRHGENVVRIEPAKENTQIAALTNSVLLAAGSASLRRGIRIGLDGCGQSGKIKIRIMKHSETPVELPDRLHLYPLHELFWSKLVLTAGLTGIILTLQLYPLQCI
ncbi:MAG TPA: hypothetical protein DD727_04410, partial [Clostridiales bacterium]|nr:hypothetical protein [Clostridiales bacterium]